MPRYNVQNPNGEWACWSSVADDFITDFMPRKEYDKWRREEYGRQCGSLEQANRMSYDEYLEILERRKNE